MWTGYGKDGIKWDGEMEIGRAILSNSNAPTSDNELTNKKYVDYEIDSQALITEAKIPVKASDISRVRAYQSSTQTITTNNITIVELQTKDFDNLGEFDNTTNYRFTVTKAGYYLINGCIAIASLSIGQVLTSWIYINGNGIARNFTRQSSDGDPLSSDVFTLQYLNVDDYIDLRVYHNDGSSQDLIANTNSTYLEIHRLS